MDLEKKLLYYRSDRKQDNKKQEPEVSASLKALAEIFNAEIFQSQAPYLKICKLYPLPKDIYKNPELSLDLLSKKTVKENIHLENCLFFDLETTGLAGGTGTYPFLLGFGYFMNNVLHVEQYFLPDFGREFYLFKELDEFFRRFSILVSYNGKSYDYPLLRNRFVMNKLNAEWTHWKHIDLLHIVRRIWSDSFPSRDLQTIEREVLGRKREGDIPGYLIPGAYFD